MDLSLESALTPPGAPADPPGYLAGRPLDEWNAAYARVETYFQALRMRNKVLVGHLVIQVLRRAMQRALAEPHCPTTQLAAEELDRVVTEWFAQVLQESAAGSGQMLSTRGRMALFLADMPGKWQDQFLQPGPWPEEFVKAMRETYLDAGPDFQLSKMAPRPLDLGPIATLTSFGRVPYLKMVVGWLLFALVLIVLFKMTHR